jgi:16S rRNA G966 N2-methylase RsmD
LRDGTVYGYEALSRGTLVAVLLDFYATILLTNLVAFAEMDCETELELANQSHERKYEYRVNNWEGDINLRLILKPLF